MTSTSTIVIIVPERTGIIQVHTHLRPQSSWLPFLYVIGVIILQIHHSVTSFVQVAAL